MFDRDALTLLCTRHEGALTGLAAVEQALNARFYGMAGPVRGLVLAVASGEPLLLIGPPGTAKSRLVRAFCGLIGLVDETRPAAGDGDYFEYLLTPFTEPGELFGYFDIARLHAREGLHRIDVGMMQHAKVVFLDEVFNGSSAILNSLLTFINERVFHDRGLVVPVAMECLFGATNEIPRAAELRAIFDRFLLRSRVDNVEESPQALASLMQYGWRDTYTPHGPDPALGGLLEGLVALRADIARLTSEHGLEPAPDPQFFGNLAHLVRIARQYGVSAMSNRRLVKMMSVMLLHRLYRTVSAGDDPAAIDPAPGPEELALFWEYFLDSADPLVVDKMRRLAFEPA